MAGITAGKAIVTMLSANGTIYLSVFESGSSAGGDALGSVYSLDVNTAKLTKLGDTFPANHIPYSLLWAYGRLWCGTGVNVAAGATPGRVYWFRPDIDTAWTLDKTFAASESIVTGLELFQGLVYASVIFSGVGASTGKVYVRATNGTYSNSDTGAIGVDASGFARGYFSLRTWPIEDSVETMPAPALYAVRNGITAETGYVIRKFDGTAWSTVYSGGDGGPDLVGAHIKNASNRVTPCLWNVNGDTSLLNSSDGVTFTERIANVTINAGMLAGFVIQR